MLEEMMLYCRNFFVIPGGVHRGHFVIRNGIVLCDDGYPTVDGSRLIAFDEISGFDDIVNKQYIRIIGSAANDGVIKYPPVNLIDEEFDGEIWALSVPQAFVRLSEKIAEFDAKNEPSAYTSESFGGYSYSKASGDNGAPITWQGVFAHQLRPYKKLM